MTHPWLAPDATPLERRASLQAWLDAHGWTVRETPAWVRRILGQKRSMSMPLGRRIWLRPALWKAWSQPVLVPHFERAEALAVLAHEVAHAERQEAGRWWAVWYVGGPVWAGAAAVATVLAALALARNIAPWWLLPWQLAVVPTPAVWMGSAAFRRREEVIGEAAEAAMRLRLRGLPVAREAARGCVRTGWTWWLYLLSPAGVEEEVAEEAVRLLGG